ncbi:MAG: V-type ATP synthase subunit B, partial [Thermoanaerobaculia bacterium]
MRLSKHSLSTIVSVQGPLIFVDKVIDARMGEVVTIVFPDHRVVEGEVLKIEGDTVLIQIFGESRGLDIETTRVVFTDAIKKAPLSLEMLNRSFGGSFQPIDELPMFVAEKWGPIAGFPLNPVARARPEELIETGFSTIDGLNTLVRGQKLPIFSLAGLPSKEIAAGILEHARAGTAGSTAGEGFLVVFVAIGLTYHDYAFYRQTLERMRGDYVAFINLAEDPVVERLLAPRF